MIDFNKLNEYKESNRLEVKAARGGLPKSVWETYSSFANTLGGLILLGVVEKDDKSLEIVGLSNADKIVDDFWDTINNQNKVSINILSSKNVEVLTIEDKNIVAITVPRAARTDKPVYINDNPMNATFRRNGNDGDYHCTKEEVQAMMRDASVKTQDMIVLENMDESVFNYETVHSYRMRMKYSRPGHVWESLEDNEFLLRLGALGRDSNGIEHPTAAGLLMFGNEYEIVREYPYYFLDYQEQFSDDTRWTDRIISSSGEWSGNIYDFYFRVYNKLAQDIKVPFAIEGGLRKDDTPVHKALREALANCLINADYYGRQGVVVIKKREKITISNPGTFRVDVNEVKIGGVSDPRNVTLMKMFNLIDVGERAGSGIPNIYSVWEQQKWDSPCISESFEPERSMIVLPLIKTDYKKSADKIGGKNRQIKSADKITDRRKNMIVEFLKTVDFATTQEIADYIELGISRTKDYLGELVKDGIITSEGKTKFRIYKLINKG
jgi:predicted HTH transcriptional regulator